MWHFKMRARIWIRHVAHFKDPNWNLYGVNLVAIYQRIWQHVIIFVKNTIRSKQLLITYQPIKMGCEMCVPCRLCGRKTRPCGGAHPSHSVCHIPTWSISWLTLCQSTMLDCFLVGNMLWMFGVVAKKCSMKAFITSLMKYLPWLLTNTIAHP